MIDKSELSAPFSTDSVQGNQPDPCPPVSPHQVEGEPQHSPEHIRELALVLFHGTQRLHAFGFESQEILEAAAGLHNASMARSKKKPGLPALELVRSQVDLNLSEAGQRILAAVIGHQRGNLKRKDFDQMELSASQQFEVLTLSAILRIAKGLDESGSGNTAIQKVELIEDGLWIVVQGPCAATDATNAKENADMWEKIGYPKVDVILPEQAAIRSMPFPEPQEMIGIQPGDPLSEAGRKVMRFHFAEMLRHEEGTRLGEDIEALHDMRVATRRLRASFEVFGSAFEKAALKPHLAGLRLTGRTLGAVRDMDVFMEKAQKYIRTLPEPRQAGLDPLLEHWQEQRAAARTQLLSHLDSREYAIFKREFNIFLNTPFAGTRPAQENPPQPTLVRQIAPMLIYERMASVRAFETLLENAPIERLHMLRIEFKKLRYTVEYFREVLGKHSLEVIETLKILQDHLGDMNDAQVATQILGEFIVTWEKNSQTAAIAERDSIEEVVSYLAARHSERHQLLLTFTNTWDTHFNNKNFRRRLAQSVAVL